MKLTGHWSGQYTQLVGSTQPAPLGLETFEVEIIEIDGTLTGNGKDTSLSDEPFTISGFCDNKIISFVKKYNRLIYQDDEGNVLGNNDFESIEIHYSGEYNQDEEQIAGTWEIILSETQEGLQDSYTEQIEYGEWFMKKSDSQTILHHKDTFNISGNQLSITDSKIHWENKLIDKTIEAPTQIRYGVSPIEIDMFTIGTNFKIQLKDIHSNQFNISIKSYLGIGKDRKYELYESLIDNLWDRFFSQNFADMIANWENGETLEIGELRIDSESIQNNKVKIKFDDMKILSKWDHILINSQSNLKQFIRIQYLKDWNWPLISEILNRKAEQSAK
ncbi:MAG: hypothetical protein CMB80_18315 [Flammeovirgaceae bacterium]|nr:hypothetical protein [Flammeovirgaceae bacterium]MBR06792.1 hypothetical protein [Rickettsiales bacterium]HCX24019.1 hypothetical protein [Cytophagales bacterium]